MNTIVNIFTACLHSYSVWLFRIHTSIANYEFVPSALIIHFACLIDSVARSLFQYNYMFGPSFSVPPFCALWRRVQGDLQQFRQER